MSDRHATPCRATTGGCPVGGRRTHTSGFSLIEIMIVVAIVGVLAAFAYPSYTENAKRARRSDAQLALLSASQAMERCRSTRFSYAACAIPPQSPERLYDIAVTERSASTYTLVATPAADGVQVSDTRCPSITLDHLGRQGPPAADDQPTVCWN